MRWISVTEELPNHSNDVLFAMKYDERPLMGYYHPNRKKWYGSYEVCDAMKDGYCDDREISAQEFITHWMELPSMPPPSDGNI
jgi:hypothetical protein